MTLSAEFEVNGDETVQAYSVAYGATVTLTAISTEFRTISWSVVATSKADLVAPTLVLSGAPTGQIATFTWIADPSDTLGRAIAVQCIQQDALGNQSVAYRVIGTENAIGEIPLVVNEEAWRHATHGYTELMNRILNASAALGSGDVTGPGSSTSGNIAVFSGTSGKVIADGGATIAALNGSVDALIFGDGSDGNLSPGFGTVTLTRDTYYNTVTPQAGDRINMAGFRVHFLDLNLTNADAGFLNRVGSNGGNGTATAVDNVGGGTAGAALSAGTLGPSGAGATGANSSAAAGRSGAAASAQTTANGGRGNTGGGGGLYGGNGGGSGGTGGTVATPTLFRRIETAFLRGATQIVGGAGGGSGGGGAAGGGNVGQAGGGGASGGGVAAVYIKHLTIASSTGTGAISCAGGNGGNGGTNGATAGGGGGGGAGGGGGYLYCVIGSVTGSKSGLMTCAGGNGGSGGSPGGAGVAGTAGAGGDGGNIFVAVLHPAAFYSAAGTTPSGATGGTCSVSL